MIVNCRNSEKYLRDCLESIQQQTFSHFEVIVWDNMSTDDTAKIVNEFEQADPRFQLHSGNESLNLGAARNCAVDKSSGRYLAFLDSDDLWEPDFLQHHHDSLTKFKKDLFGTGNVMEVSEDFNISMISEYSKSILQSTLPKPIFKKLLKGNTVYFSSVVFPRNFFLNETGFRNDFVQAEDYELLLRLANKYPTYRTGLVFYRVHSGNASNQQEESLYQESIEVLNSYLKWLPARLHRLNAIGRYHRFLAPLNSNMRDDRILLTGVTRFEIRVARIYLAAIEQLQVLIARRKR